MIKLLATLKSNCILIGFAALLLFMSCLNLFMPDQDISKTERRHLAGFPKLDSEAVLKGNFTSDLEAYLLDQFLGRDFLRSVKSDFSLSFLRMKDSNHYYKVGDGLYEFDASLNENHITRAGTEFSKIAETYFPNSPVYYSIIPDKNYYVADQNGYPHLNYHQLETLFKDSMDKNFQYISLMDTLTIDDYYRTDLHWKQERIVPVADTILSIMDKDNASHDLQTILCTDAFYGGYAGASAISTSSDTLSYLTNDMINQMKLYNYETKQLLPLYATDKLSGTDPYDVYLWGAKALLRIDNPQNTTGKELVLFRDSFGSSIAPLLAQEYSTVYLIDLRYVTAKTALDLITPTADCDVLFLYSTTVLNKSNSMRF